jgi:protein ImuB
MQRVLSLFLPQWPIERRSDAARRAKRPFILATMAGGRRIVTAANEAAQREGISAGMGLSDARTLYPEVGIGEADFAGDATALLRLARWCDRFSPWTTPDGKDGIFLDVTGCAHLFGGEAGLIAQMIERLRRRGIMGRAALADSPGAAWAIARFGGGRVAVVSRGGARPALADLPVAALRLEPSVNALLMRLGLRRIGELYPMSRAALVVRCGEALALRLDEALGVTPEPLSPLSPEKLRWSHRSFAEPILSPEAIGTAIQNLLQHLCRHLAEEDVGARQLTLSLYRVDGCIEKTQIGTALPTRDPSHLWRLFEERLPSIDPGLGIEDMVLTATLAERLVPMQLGLDGAAVEDNTDLAALIDRLTNRLGPRALARPVLRESHIPERAVRFQPPLDKGNPSIWNPKQQRPVRLLSRPEPIEAMAMVPDDPPFSFRWRHLLHRVRHADGPERIAPEWWRNDAELRDYYRVEDEEGRRFWLYRAGLFQPAIPPRWFLHGLFA